MITPAPWLRVNTREMRATPIAKTTSTMEVLTHLPWLRFYTASSDQDGLGFCRSIATDGVRFSGHCDILYARPSTALNYGRSGKLKYAAKLPVTCRHQVAKAPGWSSWSLVIRLRATEYKCGETTGITPTFDAWLAGEAPWQGCTC